MPIVKQHGNSHTVPGTVFMHGLFVFGAAGEADPTRSQSPGITLVPDATGTYILTFNDGVTPGITVPILRHVVDPAQPNPRFIQVNSAAQLLAGSTGFIFLFRQSAGTLVDPVEDSAIGYQITRLNTSVVYK